MQVGEYGARLRALEATGVRVSMLHDEPIVTAREQLAVIAFGDLRGERQMSAEVIGSIPWRAIDAWCSRYAVPDAEEFIELVQTIDAEWLARGVTRVTNRENSAKPGAQVGRGVASRFH